MLVDFCQEHPSFSTWTSVKERQPLPGEWIYLLDANAVRFVKVYRDEEKKGLCWRDSNHCYENTSTLREGVLKETQFWKREDE